MGVLPVSDEVEDIDEADDSEPEEEARERGSCCKESDLSAATVGDLALARVTTMSPLLRR